MDEMTQIGEILSSGPAASLGMEEEQEALESELSELLAESASAAAGSPQSPVDGLQVPAKVTTLPTAPAMKEKQSLDNRNKDVVDTRAAGVPQLA